MLDNLSLDKHWQGIFFLSEAWKNEQRPAIWGNFAKGPCSLNKFMPHGEEEVERIRAIVGSPAGLKKVDAIPTYDRITSTGVIPPMLAMDRSLGGPT